MIKKKLIDLTSNDVEIIIRNNYDDIFKYCFWKVRDYTDAEDLTQDTFMKFIEYSIIHRKVWANLFDARGREWLEKYVKTRIHYLALLQIRKMSEGYILSIKDVEIICSFYEEAIFGLLIRWIIKEEKAKTVDEIKDTVERIEKLFEGQLDLIISNMKK